jgi:hypothetical protein
MVSIVVVGDETWGSFHLQGDPIVSTLGAQHVNPQCLDEWTEMKDVCILIKTDSIKRTHCRRIIYHPIDMYVSENAQHKTATQWIREKYEKVRFDAVIATTRVFYNVCVSTLPDYVTVCYLPHYADERVAPNSRDRNGPIVYAGLPHFVKREKRTLTHAANRIGRRIVFDHSTESWRSLDGAALVLATRFPPYASPLDKVIKSCIKVENAARAGVPVLITNDDAITSTYGENSVTVLDEEVTVENIANCMELALNADPPGIQITKHEYVQAIMETCNRLCVESTGIVITTHGHSSSIVMPCLESVLAHTSEPRHIIVYDNEGTDPVTARLAERDDLTYVHVADQSVGGLTWTWEDGIRRCLAAGCDVVVLLNHDTRVDATWPHLIMAARTGPRGCYGPTTDGGCWGNSLNQESFVASEKPTIERFSAEKLGVDNGSGPGGFCMAFHRETLDASRRADGRVFNPAYPWGNNETEWHRRWKANGGDMFTVRSCFVHHQKRHDWLRVRTGSRMGPGTA